MLKNSVKISNYLSNLCINISSIKRIVYKAKKFGIQSLFILIQFEIDQIDHARPHITVT
jgi:hypothetical protein